MRLTLNKSRPFESKTSQAFHFQVAPHLLSRAATKSLPSPLLLPPSAKTMAPAPHKKGIKRSAPSDRDRDSGPAAKKKRSLDKREKPQEKKKRARPVVAAPAESDESELDDEPGFEEVPMERDEETEVMEVDGQPPKDPNGNAHTPVSLSHFILNKYDSRPGIAQSATAAAGGAPGR